MTCNESFARCSASISETSVQIIRVEREKLREKGRIHYFYHARSSKLPIRDVCNEQGEGHKTEPHIEIGAENFICPCRPTNIVAHLNRYDEKYLFLVTRNASKNMIQHIGFQPYIVGYIVKEEHLLIDRQRHVVKGKTVIYPFNESVPYYDIFPDRFAPMRLVDEGKTREILSRFPNMDEQHRIKILRDCVQNIEELDEKNEKECKTCVVLRGGRCKYQGECLRRNL